MKSPPLLSLIIPAYNEQERIVSTLEQVLAYLHEQSYTWEILVINDGSTDATGELVKRYAPIVQHVPLHQNMGKGAAVRTGMLVARGQYRVFTDADLSTPIHQLPKMVRAFEEGADVVIGSRRLEQSIIYQHQPWYREIIGIAGNALVQLLLFKGIEDTQCGFKGCTACAAVEIFSRAVIDGFGFDIEMLYLAQLLGFNVVQIPIEWINDTRTRVRTIRDALRTLREVFLIRRIHPKKFLLDGSSNTVSSRN